MSSEKMYDDLLYPILCSEGNIHGFFDKIFEFLYRRTDFFKLRKITKDDSSNALGLPDGEAENIVRSFFCKYMQQTVTEVQAQELFETDSTSIVSDYIAEEEVITSEPDTTDLSTTVEELSMNPKSSEETNNTQSHPDDELDKKIPVMDHDCYNGAAYEDYSWAQTLRDVDIRIKVPSEVVAGRMVSVHIRQTHLKVELLHNGKSSEVLKDDDLPWKINVEESMWTLMPGEHVHICLQKVEERWWDSAFVGEPKIDVKAIDPTIPYDELDSESQTKIEELMYNEHLKRLGKPNVQQTKLHNILKEAWDKDGSPFKGQPFDPGAVNIQNAENFGK